MLRDNKPAEKSYDKNKMAQLLYPLQNNCCHKCKKRLSPCFSSIHHALIHNNNTNRKCYPSLVHHPVNLVLLCGDCHQLYGNYMQVSNYEIVQEIVDAVELMEIYNYSVKAMKANIYSDYATFINQCKE